MGYWYAGNWVDAAEISLSVTDPSLLFGATIFTTLRVHHGNLYDPDTHWQDHGDRLRRTIQQMHWPEVDWQSITSGAEWIAQDYPVVRVTLLSDGRELIIGRQLPSGLPEMQRNGIAAWLATEKMFQRPMADFKTGNYLGAWQARNQAIVQGAGEAILLDTEGHWLETATGNLWGLSEGQWYTPPTGGILPGVMRLRLIAKLEQLDKSVVEVPWTMELIQSFEAIAYSNSVVGVIPFTEILPNARKYNLQAIQSDLHELQQLSGCLDFLDS